MIVRLSYTLQFLFITATAAAANTGAGATAKTAPTPAVPNTVGMLAVEDRAASVATTVTVAAPLPSTAPEFVSDELFVSAILNSTNVYRSQHNATAAVWNSTIAAYAAAYLANTTEHDRCRFAHSGGPYGENIAIGCSDATSCVDAWGDERQLYDFGRPAFSEATGHFTQLVWKSSTTVGCGRRLCTGSAGNQINSGWFLVCEYWPRGNVIGQFAQQVGRQNIDSSRGSRGGGGGSGSTTATATASATTGTSRNGSNANGNSNGNSSSSSTSDSSASSDASTEDDDNTPLPKRASSGVIIAALIVFVITATAFYSDISAAIKDR